MGHRETTSCPRGPGLAVSTAQSFLKAGLVGGGVWGTLGG